MSPRCKNCVPAASKPLSLLCVLDGAALVVMVGNRVRSFPNYKMLASSIFTQKTHNLRFNPTPSPLHNVPGGGRLTAVFVAQKCQNWQQEAKQQQHQNPDEHANAQQLCAAGRDENWVILMNSRPTFVR